LTAVRLIVLHNLTYMHELTVHARSAIKSGRFDSYRAAILAGSTPWQANTASTTSRKETNTKKDR